MLRKVVSQTVHPFSVRRRRPGAPEDLEELTRLGSECAAGARVRGEFAARLISDTRPDLAIVVFTEVHHVSHPLWHTVVPDHSLYAGESFSGDGSLPGGVAEVYREVDRQVGRLVKAAGRNSDVIALSLHGIKPARGIVTVLDPLLCGLGFAHRPDWSTRSWSGQVRASLAQIKRHIPSAVKRSYHSTLPPALRRRLARTTILPVYDWSRTRAFSLPTDQHGLVRLNVVGREASGIVPPEQYQETCELVTESLLGVMREDGQPVVRDVIRLSEAGERPPHRLPDLVVHWHDAAFARPLRTASPRVEAHPVRLDRTGEHAPDGFSIMRGDFGGERIGESTLARDLHRYALAGLGVG
jgi:predicted AlkP superfamily phosphohydrolase/phosphomutase